MINVNTTYTEKYFEKPRRDKKETENKRELKFEKKENLSVKNNGNISAKNEAKLSKKAQEYLKTLREKYGDYDVLVSSGTDDLMSLSKSGSKEYSVILSNDELERMASDEKYAAEKMQGIDGAVDMCKKICEEEGYVSAYDAIKAGNGTVNKIGIISDDNGNMKFFAELGKTSDKQKERIEKLNEKKAEDKSDKKVKEKDLYKAGKKDYVKRTTVEAASMEELIERISNINWEEVPESKSGDRFDFSI